MTFQEPASLEFVQIGDLFSLNLIIAQSNSYTINEKKIQQLIKIYDIYNQLKSIPSNK